MTFDVPDSLERAFTLCWAERTAMADAGEAPAGPVDEIRRLEQIMASLVEIVGPDAHMTRHLARMLAARQQRLRYTRPVIDGHCRQCAGRTCDRGQTTIGDRPSARSGTEHV